MARKVEQRETGGEILKTRESIAFQYGGKAIKMNDIDLSDYPITKLEAEAKSGYLEMHIDFKFRLANAEPVLYKASIERDQEEIEKAYNKEYFKPWMQVRKEKLD